MRLRIIVPAHNAARYLPHVLPPLRANVREGDALVLVDDASTDDTAARAEAQGVQVQRLVENGGAAVARNHAAALGAEEILVFVDADVEVHADALERIRTAFQDDERLDAIFGSYDTRPPGGGVVSTFRNLLHAYTHKKAPGRSTSFWGGLGAVRRLTFEKVGGFPDTAMEDVALGARLTKAGAVIRLDPAIEGAHHKHWTFASMIRTDLMLRGAPWVRFMLAGAAFDNRLATRAAEKWKVALAGVLVALAVGSPFAALFGGISALAVLGLAIGAAALAYGALNFGFFAFLARHAKAPVVAAAPILMLIYHTVCGLSVLLGVALHAASGGATPDAHKAGRRDAAMKA